MDHKQINTVLSGNSSQRKTQCLQCLFPTFLLLLTIHPSFLTHSFSFSFLTVYLVTYTTVSLHMACYLMTFLGVRDTVDIPTSLLSYQNITSSHHCITAVFQHTVLGGLKHFRKSNSNNVLYSLFLEVKKEWKIGWTSALVLTRELHLPP